MPSEFDMLFSFKYFEPMSFCLLRGLLCSNIVIYSFRVSVEQKCNKCLALALTDIIWQAGGGKNAVIVL